MKIRSVIRRKQGSSVTLDGVIYRWNDGNGHVCEVENPKHAEKLLSHPEGWRVAEAATASTVAVQTAQPVARAAAPRARKADAASTVAVQE